MCEYSILWMKVFLSFSFALWYKAYTWPDMRIDKYRNTISKIDEIPIPHLRSVKLISRVCLSQPQALRENVRRPLTDRYSDRKARLDWLDVHICRKVFNRVSTYLFSVFYETFSTNEFCHVSRKTKYLQKPLLFLRNWKEILFLRDPR